MKSSTKRPAPLIEGHVATVFKESRGNFYFVKQELAINIGADHGVETGMQFDVLEKEILIKDPESGEHLGVVTSKKGKVQVTTVNERFSIAVVVESPSAPLSVFPAIDNLKAGDRVVEVRQEDRSS